jgi:hypothetical protein
MLTDKDYKYIGLKGIDRASVERQLQAFVDGFPPLQLDRPALAGDGILRLDDSALDDFVKKYENHLPGKSVVKFVPASGAATRMFKDVFAWRDRIRDGLEVKTLFKLFPDAREFFSRMKEFAFWEDLSMVLYKDCLDADHLLADENYLPILEYLLANGGLQYSNLPKGLLKFHRYPDGHRTAMEEHLAEGAAYACQDDGRVVIHLTVSPEHEKKFRDLFEEVRGKYEKQYGVTFELSFSIQKPSTDTIAVNMKNQPLRDKVGKLLFRPGGHGALIENLNELNGDIIFIKNIDNVVPDHLREPTVRYKKVLGGVLLSLQETAHEWLQRLEQAPLDGEAYEQAVAFATNELNIDPAALPEDAQSGSDRLRELLNRPIRVCGMVKNQGEPGGGPFWVKDRHSGHNTLQIVEASQVNMNDSRQQAILKQSTHFNPVDLVCAVKDHHGIPYDLKRFIDPETGFISRKSKNGDSLKALELPGLWNGAMAYWNTVFVEVPLITFNPVKTINDLLRKEHL